MCARNAAAAVVRLIVEDDLAELMTCADHADWLLTCVEEDAQVTLLEVEPATDTEIVI